jgi:hypothetical protein
MNKIPTAKEFYKEITGCVINHKDIETTIIEFAKLHVQEALKEASEEATITYEIHEDKNTGIEYTAKVINKDSILNAYPLENIK